MTIRNTEQQRSRVKGVMAGENRQRLKVTVCIQGGGMRGAWQGGVLDALFNGTDPIGNLVAAFGSSAGAINAAILSRKIGNHSSHPFYDVWCQSFLSKKRLFRSVLAVVYTVVFFEFALPAAILLCVCLKEFRNALLRFRLSRKAVGHSLVAAVFILVVLFIEVVACHLLLPWRTLLCVYVIGALAMMVYLMASFCISGCRRFPGILPFRELQWVVGEMLGTSQSASFYTYLYATSLDSDSRPLYDSQNPCTFLFAPGIARSKINLPDLNINGDVSFLDAVAASCCLPLLTRSFQVDRRPFADGGMYSNLPANFLISYGTLGADIVLLILSKRLDQLDPSCVNVDYRMLALLHELQGHASSKKSPFGHYPVAIVQPCGELACDTLKGLFCCSLRRHDYSLGYQLGRAVENEMSDWLRGTNTTNFEARWLASLTLPNIPYGFRRIKDEWWKWFSNRQWAD